MEQGLPAPAPSATITCDAGGCASTIAASSSVLRRNTLPRQASAPAGRDSQSVGGGQGMTQGGTEERARTSGESIDSLAMCPQRRTVVRYTSLQALHINPPVNPLCPARVSAATLAAVAMHSAMRASRTLLPALSLLQMGR